MKKCQKCEQTHTNYEIIDLEEKQVVICHDCLEEIQREAELMVCATHVHCDNCGRAMSASTAEEHKLPDNTTLCPTCAEIYWEEVKAESALALQKEYEVYEF